MRMPRRVYDASYGEHPVALSWHWLTHVSAVGGPVLFVSAAFFMMVMVGTALAGAKRAPELIQWAEALDGQPRRTVFDRFGLWALVAVVLVVIAYAIPLWNHLHMPRFGSPGFAP